MTVQFTGTLWRLVIAGVILWTLTAITYGTLRLTFGSRPAYVHVRWAPSVDDKARHELEQRHGLRQGELREGRTWGYAITDLSRGNIGALVTDASVEDTHQIHRTAFRVGYFAPRLAYLTLYPWLPVGLEVLSALFGLAGLAAFGLAVLERAAPRAVRGPLAGLRNVIIAPRAEASRGAVALLKWIPTRIPEASAESAALFRVVFGAALLILVLQRPVGDAWASRQTNVLSAAHELLLGVFRRSPWLAEWIAPWVGLWGGLFIIGAFARTAFVLTTLGVFAWAILHTTSITYHTISALLVALLCLSWSRWGDAWSVDAWRHRHENRRGTPKEYGYTSWMPGLVLGVIFAAAAFAKLRESGLSWILNGTVKYHFLSDSRQAMVDWGLQLGQNHAAAVLLSFGAIAIESLVIVGVLSRRYRYRLIAGIAALSLLIGFVLLQGLFWPGWWILLLSFLPWHLVPASHLARDTSYEVSREDSTWPRLFQPAAVAVVVMTVLVQQLVVSCLRIEVSPLISTYDMYSTTYASPVDYEQKAGDSYWLVTTDDAKVQCRIGRMEANVIAAAATTPAATTRAAQIARRCFDPSVHVRSIAVEKDHVRVDWARWQPGESERVRLTDPIAVAP